MKYDKLRVLATISGSFGMVAMALGIGLMSYWGFVSAAIGFVAVIISFSVIVQTDKWRKEEFEGDT